MLCWYYYNIVERNKQSVKKKLRIENINEKIGRASTEKVGEAEKIYIGEADTDTFHFSLFSLICGHDRIYHTYQKEVCAENCTYLKLYMRPH